MIVAIDLSRWSRLQKNAVWLQHVHQNRQLIDAHLWELHVRAAPTKLVPVVNVLAFHCGSIASVKLVCRFTFSSSLPAWTKQEVAATVNELSRLFSADNTFDICNTLSVDVVHFVATIIQTAVATVCGINARQATADVVASVKVRRTHSARMKQAVLHFVRDCTNERQSVAMWMLHATAPKLITFNVPVAIWIDRPTAQDSAFVLTYLISLFSPLLPDTVKLFGFRPGQTRTITGKKTVHIRPDGARFELKSTTITKNGDTRALVCFVPQPNVSMPPKLQEQTFKKFGSAVLQRGKLNMTVGFETVVVANWTCKPSNVASIAFAAVAMEDVFK